MIEARATPYISTAGAPTVSCDPDNGARCGSASSAPGYAPAGAPRFEGTAKQRSRVSMIPWPRPPGTVRLPDDHGNERPWGRDTRSVTAFEVGGW